VVNFLTGTGIVGSTIPVTGVGFKPQVIIFFASGDTAAGDTAARIFQAVSLGFAVSPTDRRYCAMVCNDSVDPTVSTNISGRHSGVNCLAVMNSGGGNGGEADLQSMGSDGFTLVVKTAFGASDRIFALCIAGIANAKTNAKTGQFQVPGATGNFSVNGLGFKPDIVFFMSTDTSAAPPTTHSNAPLMIGMMTSVAQGVVHAFGSRGTTIRRKYMVTTDCIGLVETVGGTISERAQYVSMDSDGFTVNFVARANPRYIHWLAIQGGTWSVGSLTARNDLTDTVVSGLLFQPAGILFASDSTLGEVPGTSMATGVISIGAASSASSQGCVSETDLDGVNPTNVDRGQRADEVYQVLSGGATSAVMRLKSIQTTGFTTVMDLGPGADALVLYAAVGDPVFAGNYPHAGL